MRPMTAARTINAPLDLVSRSVSDVCILQKVIPRITGIESCRINDMGQARTFAKLELPTTNDKLVLAA